MDKLTKKYQRLREKRRKLTNNDEPYWKQRRRKARSKQGGLL